MKLISLLAFALALTFLLTPSAFAQQNAAQAADGSLGETQQDMNYSDANGTDAFGGVERNGHTSDDGPHGKPGEEVPTVTMSQAVVLDTKVEAVLPLAAILPEKALAATEIRSLDNLKALYR